MTISFYDANKNDLLTQPQRTTAEQGELDYRVEGGWFGGAELKGRRPFQEDRMIAIALSATEKNAYNKLTAKQKTNLLKDTIDALNHNILNNSEIKNQGSTGLIAILEPGQQRCLFANLGDSRLIQVHLKKNGEISVARLNALHNPSEASEKDRITKDGGFILNNRLGGGLGVSRSFGDAPYLPYGLSTEADIEFKIFSLEEGDEIFLITACDGLTEKDGLTLQDIGLYVGRHRKKSLSEIALGLANCAYEKGSGDNISVQMSKLLPASTEIQILGIFDGHGERKLGHVVSQYLKDNFSTTFNQTLAHLAKEIENKRPVAQDNKNTTKQPSSQPAVKKSQPASASTQPSLQTATQKQPSVSRARQQRGSKGSKPHPIGQSIKPKQMKRPKVIASQARTVSKNLMPSNNKNEEEKISYAAFLPLGMLGTAVATVCLSFMSSFMLMPFITMLGLFALYKEYQVFNAYKAQNGVKHQAKERSSEDLNKAFDLGVQSATHFSATLKAFTSPRLWLYPAHINAYYAGQVVKADNEKLASRSRSKLK